MFCLVFSVSPEIIVMVSGLKAIKKLLINQSISKISSRQPHAHFPWWETADAELRAQGLYERFPLSQPGVGQNIAFHVAPADRTSTYLVSTFPVHSTSFFPQIYLIVNSEMCLKQ